MAKVEVPDGTTISWREHGSGPGVLVAGIAYGYPEMFQGLVDDLAADHRVVVPDLRGTGDSSRQGPYEMASTWPTWQRCSSSRWGDVAIGLGDGALRAVELAAARPDLVERSCCPATPRSSGGSCRTAAGLSGSGSVLSALVRLLETDYRSAIRTIVSTGSPELGEAGIRERVDRVVANCSHEAALARIAQLDRVDAGDAAQALGDRLWILHHPQNPWFPASWPSGSRSSCPRLTSSRWRTAPSTGPTSPPRSSAGSPAQPAEQLLAGHAGMGGSVHEQRRRRGNPRADPAAEVPLHPLRRRIRAAVGLEAVEVDAQRLAARPQVRVVEAPLVLVERVVELPEAALARGGLGGLGEHPGPRVLGDDGEVAEHPAHRKPREQQVRLGAVRALEVRVLDDEQPLAADVVVRPGLRRRACWSSASKMRFAPGISSGGALWTHST